MMWSIYEIIHFWTAVVDESEELFWTKQPQKVLEPSAQLPHIADEKIVAA